MNIGSYLILGLLDISSINTIFWMGLGYEAVFGVISIVLISWIYIKIFHEKPKEEVKNIKDIKKEENDKKIKSIKEKSRKKKR